MKSQRTSRVLAGSTLLALVLSFLAPLPAWAEDTLPPAEPPLEAILAEPAPPTESSPPAESETLPGEAEPPLAAEAAPAPAESQPEGLTESLPEGTTIAVVGAEAELLPLASEEAAAVIAVADPVWCPASVKAPTPGSGGCSPAETSMAGLLIWLVGNEPATDGIIWIQGGSQLDASPIVFDGGTVLTTMSQYKLTLRGGWDGDDGSKKTDPLNPSIFGTTLAIYDWHNDVTLSDLVVDGTTGGIGSVAIDVRTEGSISLTGVDATDNQGTGARLDNTSSTTPRGITVKNGEFSRNSGNNGGLYIISDGKITLTDVVASGNSASSGASLSNTSATTAQPVSLTGTNTFNDNGTSGLIISSLGAITLNNLTASGNGLGGVAGYGAELYNSSAATPLSITLTGASTFNDNLDTGLTVVSLGAFTGNNLTASNNGEAGLGLYNASAAAAGGVTLTGTNVFTGNGDDGLNISSRGALKLNNVRADSNGDFGAFLTNTSAPSAQPVTFSGSSSFKYNDSHGLYLLTNGAITANNITASGNTNSGVFLNNRDMGYASKVTFTGASAFNDNGATGLDVYTWGSVTLANLTASRNGDPGVGWGVDISNIHIPYTMPVTLTGINLFDGNFSGGLRIQSSGAITASNLSASRSLGGPGAELANSNTESPQKVSLTGTSSFSGNATSGLLIYSLGPIGASNLVAEANAADGAFLRNDYLGASGGVTLSGTNRFSGNSGNGLALISFGAISANNVTATGNGLGSGSDGVHLSNSGGTAAGIKLTGTNTLSGNGSGLTVYSRGSIALANVTASGNTLGNGVTVNNTYGGADVQPPVTLTGTNTFNDNRVSGLSISTYGAVTLSSVTASRNGLVEGWGFGVHVDNFSGTLPKPVTLSGSYLLDGNDEEGLYIYSRGALKVNNLSASHNGSYGAWLYTYDGITIQPATLTGSSLFEGNYDTGLYLTASGEIRAANLTARGNALSAGWGFGAFLANDGVGSAGGITLTGTNLFTNNRGGLNVLSTGPISVSNLTASGSTHDNGADLRNSAGLASGVTLSGTAVFDDNWNNGLHIMSTGPISLNTTSLQAIGNGVSTTSGEGARLYNAGASTPQKVVLKGTGVFNDNLSYGLDICSTGPITASNLTANGSLHWGGASLSTTGAGASGSVTLSGANVFLDNYRGGLSIDSSGPITVNNLTARGNGIAASNGYGTSLSNNLAATPQSIKLTGVNAVNDNYWGLYVSATGPISVNNLTASGNARSNGAVLDNTTLGSVGGVTLTGSNIFEQNYYGGLSVLSLGAITANNLRAQHNGLLGGSGAGVSLANAAALTPQAVKITGTSSFVGNQGDGLVISSIGAVTASNLTARVSVAGYGVFIDNDAGTADVTLTGTNLFSENASSGLWIESHGMLSLTRISADGNGGAGMWVNNNAAGLTLTCGSFINNTLGGLAASTMTMPVLIGVVASGNGASDLWWSGGTITGIVRACPLD